MNAHLYANLDAEVDVCVRVVVMEMLTKAWWYTGNLSVAADAAHSESEHECDVLSVWYS